MGVGAHEGQRLPLGLEARDDALRIHAQLDDLERHLPPHRLRLFGQINDPATAFADLLKQCVAANAVAGLFSERERRGPGSRWRRAHERRLQKLLRPFVGFNQARQLLKQRRVVTAGPLQEGGPLRGGQFQRRVQQGGFPMHRFLHGASHCYQIMRNSEVKRADQF
jgi:hypothetical protein